MRDDAVAEILGAHLASAEPSAALWHRVAHGRLSADEAAAQLLAARPDMSEQERAEIERAKRVFAPPSAEQRREQLAALLERRADAEVAGDPRATDGEAQASAKHGAEVVPLASHRRRRWAVGLLAAAAAIALTVWLVPPRSGGDEAFVAQYGIELAKDRDEKRGAEPGAEVPTFQVDWKIVIRLVPGVAVKGPVGVVMYVKDSEGQARRLEVEPTLNDEGVMALGTTVQALGLEVGEHELVVAVGRPDALPSSWEALVDAERVGPVGFEVVRKTIQVVPPPSKNQR